MTLIRPAQHDDAHLLEEIYSRSWLDSNPNGNHEQQQLWLQKHNHAYWIKYIDEQDVLIAVDEKDGNVVGAGFVSGMHYKDDIYLMDFLFLDPIYRGRNIGGRLFAHMEDHAVQKGYNNIVGMVFPDNVNAQNMYTRRGWKRTGETSNEGVFSWDIWLGKLRDI